MTNKLEEAAKNYIDGEAERDREFWDSMMGRCPHCEHEGTSIFKAGAQWLATELRTLAFPNNTEDQVIRLSDLEKIVGEE